MESKEYESVPKRVANLNKTALPEKVEQMSPNGHQQRRECGCFGIQNLSELYPKSHSRFDRDKDMKSSRKGFRNQCKIGAKSHQKTFENTYRQI